MTRFLFQLSGWLSSPSFLWVAAAADTLMVAFWTYVMFSDGRRRGYVWMATGIILSAYYVREVWRDVHKIREDRAARRRKIVEDVMES